MKFILTIMYNEAGGSTEIVDDLKTLFNKIDVEIEDAMEITIKVVKEEETDGLCNRPT
jgi:hypothetical protein